jgi:glycosyltransferase involved in cell wall biosynthesis
VRRILFCPPLYPPSIGGSERLFHALATRWSAGGGESVVYTLAPDLRPLPADGFENGVLVRRFAPLSRLSPRRRGALLGALSRLGPAGWRSSLGFPHILTPGYRRALRAATADGDGPFDLFVGGVLPHAHFLAPASRFAAARRLPLIVIPLLHAGLLGRWPEERVFGPGARPLLRQADIVVALTPAEVAPLEAAGVRRDRIRVLPAGLDTIEAPGGPGAFARRHRLRGPYLLQAGALRAEKGTLDLLAAHARLAGAGRAITLVLAGRPDEDVRRGVSAARDAGRDVLLVEAPDTAEWDDALRGAYALAHPSRGDSFGLVILEAWRAGVPAVVANAGGPAHLIRHGRDGLVVAPGDPDALAGALDALLVDPGRASRLGAAGGTRVADYTWERIYPAWAALFEGTRRASTVAEGA